MLGCLFVAATSVFSAAAFECFRYGPTYHRGQSEPRGIVTIAANGTTPACAGNETTPCVTTCPSGIVTCYNFYQYRGYGPDGVGPGN